MTRIEDITRGISAAVSLFSLLLIDLNCLLFNNPTSWPASFCFSVDVYTWKWRLGPTLEGRHTWGIHENAPADATATGWTGKKGQFLDFSVPVTKKGYVKGVWWRVCVPSLTVVVREGQQGVFLQPLRQLVVRPRMLSGPVRDEDQRPGKKEAAEAGNKRKQQTSACFQSFNIAELRWDI